MSDPETYGDMRVVYLIVTVLTITMIIGIFIVS